MGGLLGLVPFFDSGVKSSTEGYESRRHENSTEKSAPVFIPSDLRYEMQTPLVNHHIEARSKNPFISSDGSLSAFNKVVCGQDNIKVLYERLLRGMPAIETNSSGAPQKPGWYLITPGEDGKATYTHIWGGTAVSKYADQSGGYQSDYYKVLRVEKSGATAASKGQPMIVEVIKKYGEFTIRKYVHAFGREVEDAKKD